MTVDIHCSSPLYFFLQLEHLFINKVIFLRYFSLIITNTASLSNSILFNKHSEDYKSWQSISKKVLHAKYFKVMFYQTFNQRYN